MDERRIRFGVALRDATLAVERREVDVVCIRSGLSRNGNFYGPECLAEAVGLFEGAHAYVDHADTAVRSVDVITRASAGGGFARVVREADRGSWWDQCAPENEEEAALAERSRRSGLPTAVQQLAVAAGQVAPAQVGPGLLSAGHGPRCGDTGCDRGGRASGVARRRCAVLAAIAAGGHPGDRRRVGGAGRVCGVRAG